MHAFMHYHMTKHAQWSRKIIKTSVLKFSSTLLYFYTFLKHAQLISPNCLHLGSCVFSGSTFLNIENEPSTSQEVTGA